MPPRNTTRRNRLIVSVCGVVVVLVVTAITVQIAQRVVAPTCIALWLRSRELLPAGIGVPVTVQLG